MDSKDFMIVELMEQVTRQEQQIMQLEEMNKQLTSTIAELQDLIRELRRQLNQDSHNSSKPPSSDGYKKPRPKSLRKKSGKKQGGQEGHRGVHMELPHEPDEVKQHLPEKCQSCPHLAECLVSGNVFECGEKRYEVNAVVYTVVTEHCAMNACHCPCGEEGLEGSFPENVKAYIQYGDTVTVLAGLLSTYGAISLQRIHILLGSLLGVRLSTGTIASMVKRCSEKVGPIMEEIRDKLKESPVVNFDETGVDMGGSLHWVHSASTPKLTYQTVSSKRGQVGMDEGGVLPDFNGTAVHDCWAPYWKYDSMTHAACNAHILRELTAAEEYSPDHTWPAQFKNLLMSMKQAKEKAVEEDKNCLSEDEQQKFDSEYDHILDVADKECPPPPIPEEKKHGRVKKGKERSLIERLRTLKESFCLFFKDFQVPFDNNQAERDVRNVKTKVKVSGCFRTDDGVQDYLNVMSYLSTGSKHGVNVFDALTAAFSGNAKLVLQ